MELMVSQEQVLAMLATKDEWKYGGSRDANRLR
jgi:hypothetical protein